MPSSFRFNTAWSRFRLRLIVLTAAPVVVAGSISLLILTDRTADRLDAETDRIGRTTAGQLATTATEFLLSSDVLSLNVLLRDGIDEGLFYSAAIYSADQRLLASAGGEIREAEALGKPYTAEIHYQDAIAGHVQLYIDQRVARQARFGLLRDVVLVHLGLAGFCILLAFRYEDAIEAILHGPIEGAEDDDSAEERPTEPPPYGEFSSRCILITKIRPARLLTQIEGAFTQAVSLYRGEVIGVASDELTAVFRGDSEYCFRAVCSALLFRTYLQNAYAYAEFKAAMDCADGSEEALDAARKHTSYLATLSQDSLVTGETAGHDPVVRSKADLSAVPSAMAPNGEVIVVTALRDDIQRMLENQAARLQPPTA